MKGKMDSRKGGNHNYGKGRSSPAKTIKQYRESFGPATGVTPSGKPKAESKRGNNRP